jgi:hypothetical protein
VSPVSGADAALLNQLRVTLGGDWGVSVDIGDEPGDEPGELWRALVCHGTDHLAWPRFVISRFEDRVEMNQARMADAFSGSVTRDSLADVLGLISGSVAYAVSSAQLMSLQHELASVRNDIARAAARKAA